MGVAGFWSYSVWEMQGVRLAKCKSRNVWELRCVSLLCVGVAKCWSRCVGFTVWEFSEEDCGV